MGEERLMRERENERRTEQQQEPVRITFNRSELLDFPEWRETCAEFSRDLEDARMRENQALDDLLSGRAAYQSERLRDFLRRSS
jgi:hypothetical protein